VKSGPAPEARPELLYSHGAKVYLSRRWLWV
jgi:hypothetical protein